MLFLRLDTWLVIAALLGAWAITWVLLCLYLSAAGGWMRLGRTFRLAGPFRGETWERESARMRFFTKYWLVDRLGRAASLTTQHTPR